MRLETFFNLPETLEKAALLAASCGRINATQYLADCVYHVLGLETTKQKNTKDNEDKDIAA